MPYTTKQASDALDRYLDLGDINKQYIPNTKDRGFLLELSNGDKVVIFVYPLVHKQDNTKNYFDTRDSGAYERSVTWNFALQNGYKYFCLGVNDQVEKYADYIFSLECSEKTIEKISGTKNGSRNGPGNQVIIPNDYVPYKQFERIQNRLGIFIAVINKDVLVDYIEKYDNRPYLSVDSETDEDFEEYNRQQFRQWFNRLILPEGDSNAGEPYKESSINAYVQVINSIKIDVDGTEKTLFASTDVDLVQKHIEIEQADDQSKGRRVSALKKYRQFLLDRGADEDMSEFIPLVYNTSLETKFELNRIVFGAPGTGKSHGLKKDSIELLENNTIGGFERVTFHPDYTYSQFVGTYKPVMDGNEKIRYKFVAGPFMRVYVEALRSARTDNPQPYLLLVEEINRAKVAAVFGDVFQLLDRDDDGVSEYEIQPSEDIQKYLAEKLGGSPENYDRIQIPNNMFIWATMNSADQGVFPMDTAFKRRWNFEYLGINENEEKISGIGKIQLAGTEEPVEWNMLRRAINAKMSSNDFKINEDKLMGPFFLSTKIITSDENGMIIDTKKFVDAFKSKVIMYLYEDAVKQGKHRFFEGCDSSKYSSVCDAFDEKGMGIFGPNFEETFYGK
jgi:hypothetical protein